MTNQQAMTRDQARELVKDPMRELITVETESLTGEALAWAVATAQGLDVHLEPPSGYLVNWRVFVRSKGQVLEYTNRYDPHLNWHLLGELIELSKVTPVYCRTIDAWLAGDDELEGSTPLVATCRAYVYETLGEAVAVPSVLVTTASHVGAGGDLPALSKAG